MKTAKLFQNGQSQAVRLPKEFRFEGSQVYIQRVGSAVVLLPYATPWDALFESLDQFSDDYAGSSEAPLSPHDAGAGSSPDAAGVADSSRRPMSSALTGACARGAGQAAGGVQVLLDTSYCLHLIRTRAAPPASGSCGVRTRTRSPSPR